MFYWYISKKRAVMSKELLDFSNSIDEQFDFAGNPFAGVIEFILRFFN